MLYKNLKKIKKNKFFVFFKKKRHHSGVFSWIVVKLGKHANIFMLAKSTTLQQLPKMIELLIAYGPARFNFPAI